MSEELHPLFESLEDRTLLSGHMSFGPPMMIYHGPAMLAPQSPGQGMGGGQQGSFMGQTATVASVDLTANTLTVTTMRRWQTTQTTYAVSPTATITIDGAAGTLDQLVAGVKVSLQTDPTDATVLTSITAAGDKVEGRVAAVDPVAGTITLAGRRGAGTTYTVDAAVPVTVNGQDGAVAGIAVRAEVTITFSALDSTAIVAVAAEVRPITGSVTGADSTAGTITLAATYTVSPTAAITVDGKTATLDQIVSGMKVVVQTDPMDASTVTSVAAIGIKVQGRVVAVDTTAGTLTLQGKRGAADVTYPIPAEAAVTVNGATGALAGIAVGATVTIRFSAADSTLVTAVQAKAKPIVGPVAAVDLTAGTITLSSTRRGVTTQTTYSVSPSAVILIDGVVGTLDQFVAGTVVTLTTDPMNAASIATITAVGRKVEGRVTAVDATAGTITLGGRHSASTTFTVGAAAVITINGVASTLDAVAAGNRALLTLSALDATVVVAAAIRP